VGVIDTFGSTGEEAAAEEEEWRIGIHLTAFPFDPPPIAKIFLLEDMVIMGFYQSLSLAREDQTTPLAFGRLQD
jgi:hypothetical protein